MPATISGTTGGIGLIGSGTAQNTTSGTAIDFTGIPAGVKRITVMFNGVSTNGSSILQVQLGSGSVVTSGYIAVGSVVIASAAAAVTSTTGFPIGNGNAAADAHYGFVVCTLVGANTWAANGSLAGATAFVKSTAGSVTLSGSLDRIRITTVNGTDTFDAGSINILYE